MPKQCAECRTVTNSEAPYCDACGYTFPKPVVPTMTWDLKMFLGVLAMAAIAIIVVGFLRVFITHGR
jgi:hypothetical protein